MHCTLGDKLTILKGKRLKQRTLNRTEKKKKKKMSKECASKFIMTELRRSI